MLSKLIIDIISINDGSIPIYIKQNNQIINPDTNSIIYSFEYSEFSNYFYITLEYFDFKIKNNIYKSYYYIMINIKKKTTNKQFLEALQYYLILSKIYNLKSKKSYIQNNINDFIKLRSNELMSIEPWFTIKIGNYYFDLKKSKFIDEKDLIKSYFNYYGGIIESNDVKRIIPNFDPNSLIIVPNNMTQLYTNCITYDNIIENAQPSLDENEYKKYETLIIHEFDISYIYIIKDLINNIQPKFIWIINSLPLKYYFDQKIKINEISKLSNIWINFDTKNRKKYKTDLYNLFFNNFNKYYAIFNYDLDIKIPIYKISLTKFEKDLFNSINEFYLNWKLKLDSVISESKDNKIKSKIFNTFLILILNIQSQSTVFNFFKENYNQDIDIYNKDNECPICYDLLIPTRLICGHTICLDCIIKTLAFSNYCPICKHRITIPQLCIIQENYTSPLFDFFKNLNGLILTDYLIPDNYIKSNYDTVYILNKPKEYINHYKLHNTKYKFYDLIIE